MKRFADLDLLIRLNEFFRHSVKDAATVFIFDPVAQRKVGAYPEWQQRGISVAGNIFCGVNACLHRLLYRIREVD